MRLPDPLLLLAPTGSRDRSGPVAPTIAGGVITEPGRYGPAWQVAEGTTNHIRNPRCAVDTATWATGSNRELTQQDDLPAGLPARVRTGLRVRATATLNGALTGALTQFTTGAEGDYIASMYVYVPGSYASGPLIVQFTVSGVARSVAIDMTRRDEWQRVVTPVHEDLGAGVVASIQIAHFSGTWNADDEFYISCVQVEPKTYPTPYCDGSLGAGFTWSGTAHNSASTRQASNIRYALDTLRDDQGSAAFRFLMPAELGSTSSTGLYLQSVGQISGGQTNLTVMYRPQIDRLTIRTGSGYNTNELVGPKPEPGTLVSVYLEWTPETIGVDWGFGNGLQTRARGTTGDDGWLGNGIWVGGAHPSFVGNTETEGAIVFDRPLTTDERDHLLGLNRAWTWDELTGQTGRISNVVQRGGLYAVAAELWRADRHGRRIDRIPTRHPVQGTITYNEDVDVKRKLSLEISDPQVLTPFRDFLIPVVTVADAAGNVTQRAKGLFQVTPPKTRLTPARFSGTIEGLDVTYLLRRYRFEDGYTVAAGTDKGAAAREVVLTAGFLPDRVHIPDTGIVFSDDYTFDPGSSAMEIATELLVGCNFYQPFADDEGMIRTGPTVDLQRAQPTSLMCTIRTAAQLVPPLDEDPDWNRLRNRITVRNLRPDQDPIYWTESVTNPDHPLYHDPADPDTFPMLLAGDPVDDPQLETVEQAKARARSLLADGASYYRKITVQTVIDLTAGAHDVVRVNVSHPAVRYSANWKRRAWTIRLQGATGIMTSELYRVDPWEA